jgi:hypothetical protein
MLSRPAVSGPEVPPTAVIADPRMLETAEGRIRDPRPTYGLGWL